ncbi:MAG: polysaccharide deacetylase family protein, partial [Cohnella sp.]|nr:polysaccharide deacetylase family protein [Cohnella sp.]
MNKRIIVLTLMLAIVLVAVLASPRNLVTASVKGAYVPIFIYHHFDPAVSDFETMTPADFEKQIAYLHKAGYHAITVSELETFMRTGKGLPKKPIMITIDDGYESNYQYAYPVLKKYKMKATIFVIAERVGKDKQKPARLTWEQCKEMYDSGLVDIQSHSFDLHHKVKDGKGAKAPAALTRIKKPDGKLETKEEYAARIQADLLKSKEVIERNVG